MKLAALILLLKQWALPLASMKLAVARSYGARFPSRRRLSDKMVTWRQGGVKDRDRIGFSNAACFRFYAQP